MKKKPAPGDRRKRILVPTPLLLNHDAGMIRAQAKACLLVGKGEALQRAAACDAEFQRANATVNVAAFVEAMTMTVKHYSVALLVVGIAHEYRYIYWTMLCALIATPVIVSRVVMRRDLPALLRFGPLALIAAVIAFREIAVRFWL